MKEHRIKEQTQTIPAKSSRIAEQSLGHLFTAQNVTIFIVAQAALDTVFVHVVITLNKTRSLFLTKEKRKKSDTIVH